MTRIPDSLAPAVLEILQKPVAYGPTYITNYSVPPPPLRAFLVRYKGLWMGGTAIVLADCPDVACDMVREDRRTTKYESVKAEEIGKADMPAVLWNWNGDY